tara:strand:+ start:1611 stop:2750 length:1140 start_codon:yes stop_codon:yes gene_type:complete
MAHNIENSKNTLTALMMKVQDQAARAADYLAPTNDLQKTTTLDGKPQIVIEASRGEPTKRFDINDTAFGQIATHAGIDTRTARRLQSNYPREFDDLTNAIWQKEPTRRMVRTHLASDPMGSSTDGTVRAFVSDKFKTFDNVNLLEACLPQLIDNPAQFQVVSADVSEKRLYLRLKSLEQLGTGANVGDHMANGIGFGNSEVGAGSVNVHQLFWTLACTNGMQTQNKTRSSHITSARDGDQWGLLSDDAKNADNHALELKLRDLVGHYSSREAFDDICNQMRMAALDVIDGVATDVTDVVNNLGKVMQLTKKENSDVLNGLMATIGQSGFEQARPLSRATLVNAVTAVAHRADVDDVDTWQQRGGQVLNMSARDWQRVAA